MSENKSITLRQSFRVLVEQADVYLNEAIVECRKQVGTGYDILQPPRTGLNHYWNLLSDDLKRKASDLISTMLPLCATVAQRARSSPLTDVEDVRDIKVATKKMQSALRLRNYYYREAEVVHDEDRVLGFRPAEQSEEQGIPPENAAIAFKNGVAIVSGVLALVDAGGAAEPSTQADATADAKYRSNTAFIMMWMAPEQSELTDVADAIRDVFREFGIKASRADDIEHEGLVTERVINEIRSSEFLFADLTGARPNVYYEVGFAHALKKRVILFRRAGTGLHFDLAGYNCPEYTNLRDLKSKVRSRLVSLTNRNPLLVEEG